VNYAAKARDRMLVQASRDRLTTFDAYSAMGLNKDHRHYDNISQICHLLGIRAAFVLLTNNPDKVAALRAQGIRIARAEPLEVEPSPFNLAYLTSKATCGGHNLKRPTVTKIRRAQPPEPIEAFRPRALADANRFIYVASYFLPVKPVDDNPAPGAKPHWFRTHVYYDIVTSQEYIVLTYGKPRADETPIVRIHHETIFDRFPLRTAANRDKMKQTMRRIVARGSGVLLLLPDAGRGAGLGTPPDPRDHAAAKLLLKHHTT